MCRAYKIINFDNFRKANTDEIDGYKQFHRDRDSYIVLYRAIDEITLLSDFNIHIDNKNILYDIYRIIFMVGMKSNYYLLPSITAERYRNNCGEEEFPLHFSEEDNFDFFNKIFLKLEKIVLIDEYRKKVIPDFKNRNWQFIKDLTHFMNNEECRKCKLNSILLLGKNQKLAIRDYYLSLIHQLYYRPYHAKSPLISTTSSLDEALRFGNYRRRANKIIVEYLVPRREINTLVVSNDIYTDQDLINNLKKIELPIIDSPPYANQNEFSVRRALFPHYILSFSYHNDDKITCFLNPKIMNHTGLYFPINQGGFTDTIKDTRYYLYGEYLCHEGEFVQHTLEG